MMCGLMRLHIYAAVANSRDVIVEKEYNEMKTGIYRINMCISKCYMYIYICIYDNLSLNVNPISQLDNYIGI